MQFTIPRLAWSGLQGITVDIAADLEHSSERTKLRAAVTVFVEQERKAGRRPNLSAANLSAADLSAADLSDADLRAANLSAADLSDADLRDADLRDANLSAADLSAANLSAADLSDANLSAANLSAANLSAANLSAAHPTALRAIRADLFDILVRAIPEVPGLLQALREGRINGSTYHGDCKCLCGTIAGIRGTDYTALGFADADRPAERWFLGIQIGQKPDNHQVAKITEDWILEFMALVGIAEQLPVASDTAAAE